MRLIEKVHMWPFMGYFFLGWFWPLNIELVKITSGWLKWIFWRSGDIT